MTLTTQAAVAPRPVGGAGRHRTPRWSGAGAGSATPFRREAPVTAARVKELEQALQNVKNLQGLLPICCYCKKIRDDRNYWQQVEAYFSSHADVQFSHGICPDCFEKMVPTKEMGTGLT